jgi:hypothetical protein
MDSILPNLETLHFTMLDSTLRVGPIAHAYGKQRSTFPYTQTPGHFERPKTIHRLAQGR